MSDLDRAPDLAAYLADLRAQRQLSLRESAKLCGVSYVSLHHIEAGRQRPTLPTLVLIARGYGVELSELLECFGIPRHDVPPKSA